MASVLLVCTGNICRSPMAEGLLRELFGRSSGSIEVASAGIVGWEGAPAEREAVVAAAELGADISLHVARRLEAEHVSGADLVVCMAADHRDAVARLAPDTRSKTFTLKELVRLLEQLPPPEAGGSTLDVLRDRVRRADELRGGTEPYPFDEDVSDPIGMSLHTFRAVAMDIDEWSRRLVAGLIQQPVEAT